MWKEAPIKNCRAGLQKAMWLRNPWLLKLIRITLNPAHKSLRGQAKKVGLATVNDRGHRPWSMTETPEGISANLVRGQ